MTRPTAFERLVNYFFPEFFIERLIAEFEERVNEMGLNIDALTKQVADTQTAQESAIVMLHGLRGELADISAKLAATPPQEPVDTAPLDELVAKLKSSTDALAAAVANSADVSPLPTPEPIYHNPDGN